MCGVIYFKGHGKQSGHYYCEIMDWVTQEWFLCDNENITCLHKIPQWKIRKDAKIICALTYANEDYLVTTVNELLHLNWAYRHKFRHN